MKNYTLFLIYAIGRDHFDFWTKMAYDEAFEEVQKSYEVFKKWDNDQGDMYSKVTTFLQLHLPAEIKI